MKRVASAPRRGNRTTAATDGPRPVGPLAVPPSRPNDRCRGVEAAASAPPATVNNHVAGRTAVVGLRLRGKPHLEADDPYVRSMRRARSPLVGNRVTRGTVPFRIDRRKVSK